MSEWDKYPAVEKQSFDSFPAVQGQPNAHAGLEHGMGSNWEGHAAPGDFNLSAAFKQSLIRDPQTQLRVVANDLFPNDPEAVKRFAFIHGRIAYMQDDGSWKHATGRAASFIGSLIGNTPEIVGGVVGSLSSSPVVGGTLGVTGARGLKDAAAGMIFDEPQTIGGNVKDLAVNAAVEAGTAGLAKGALALANRGRRIDLAPRDLAGAQAKRDAIKSSTGVDTDLALASGDRRMLTMRNWLAQQPNETATKIQAADEVAAGQFDAATQNVLDKIATAAPADTSGRAGINAAQEAISKAKRDVSAKVRPLYDAAYASVPDVQDPAIRAFMERPAFKQADAIAVRLSKDEGKALPENVYSLERLDQVKRGLDSIIDKATAAGDFNKARVIRKAKNEFVEALDKASGDTYAAARKEYQTLTRQTVEPLENGVVGVLAKIKDARAATAAAKLFKDQNVTPGEIARTRQILEKQSPEAWQGLVRQFVANEVNAAKRVTQSGAEVNAAGKLYQRIWGDPTSRARMNAALGTDASNALKGLMESAEILARAPVRGSNTQQNLAVGELMKGPSAWWARVLLSPRNSAIQAAGEKAVEKNSAKLWEALTDPTKVKQLRIALSISDPARRATFISATILGQTGKAAAESRAISSESEPQ